MLGTRRYSPTKVTRSLVGLNPEVIATYDDATVRDNGEDGLTRAPTAMLRAYSNDPTVFDKHDEHFVCDDEKAKHYGKSLKGYVLDCDGDIAIGRFFGLVLHKTSYGHGEEDWLVLVDYDKDDEEWNGFGDRESFRLERWSVRWSAPENILAALAQDNSDD